MDELLLKVAQLSKEEEDRNGWPEAGNKWKIRPPAMEDDVVAGKGDAV